MQPLDRSTIWPYRDGEPGDFYYQRYAHPTGVEAERALAELEGGEALLFPSGSGAITALVLAELASGQTIALAEGAYYGTGALFRSLERWGLRFVEFDQTAPPPAGADLVWLEGEGDDVGAESGRDGARLVARGAVGLIERDVLACRGRLER